MTGWIFIDRINWWCFHGLYETKSVPPMDHRGLWYRIHPFFLCRNDIAISESYQMVAVCTRFLPSFLCLPRWINGSMARLIDSSRGMCSLAFQKPSNRNVAVSFYFCLLLFVCVCVCVCVGGFVLCCHFFVSLTLDLLFLFHCNGRVMALGGRNHQQQWRHAVDFSFSNLFHRFIVLSLSLSLSLSNTHTLGSTTRAFAKLGKTDMVNKEP